MIIKKITNNLLDVFWGLDEFRKDEWTRLRRSGPDWTRVSGEKLPRDKIIPVMKLVKEL